MIFYWNKSVIMENNNQTGKYIAGNGAYYIPKKVYSDYDDCDYKFQFDWIPTVGSFRVLLIIWLFDIISVLLFFYPDFNYIDRMFVYYYFFLFPADDSRRCTESVTDRGKFINPILHSKVTPVGYLIRI